jgi:predicted ArsR family transcriptional regulator
MTSNEAIKNYISYTNKPFTSLQIVAELGICYETVKKYLQELIKTEYIKQIGKDKGKNVYVYNKFKNNNSIYKAKQKHYTLESIQETYRRQIQKRRELFDDLL